MPRLIVQSPGGTGKTWLMATLAALYNEAAENDDEAVENARTEFNVKMSEKDKVLILMKHFYTFIF